MKYLLLLILTSTAIAAPAKLLDAIEKIESGGKADAVGDKGKAIGAYQIHKIMVREVNRISGKNYTYKDRYDKKKSREMCNIFLDNSKKYIKKKKGSAPTLVELSRTWNGSYKGWNRKSTKKYGAKIRKELK